MRRIGIVSINKNKYSETFIHNHVRLLPAEIHYFTGGYLPDRVCEGWEGRDQMLVHEYKSDPEPREQIKAALVAYLQEHKIEAVLSEYGASGVEMMEVCAAAGIAHIVHFHGYCAYREDRMKSHGHRYPWMFALADAVIGVSHHMVNRLRSLGASGAKLHYIPYGPDEGHFQCTDPAANPPVFLGVGRFAETKSPHLTLMAFAEVLKEIPEARLVFAGDGHLELACKIMAEALGIDHAVTFSGAVSHEEVGRLMQNARAFVQHSLTTPVNDTEGTPVAIIEAQASGLPVVSTRHAGIPDVVLEGETGYLVDERDYRSMVPHMIALAKDPELAARLGRAGHERINAHFTLKMNIDKLWKVIEECIQKRS